MKRSWKSIFWVAVCGTVLPLAACTQPQGPTRLDSGNGTESNTTEGEVDEDVDDIEAPEENAGIGDIDLPGGTTPDTNGETTETLPDADDSDAEDSGATDSSASSSTDSEAKMSVEKTSFGETPDGEQVDLYTCTNANGVVLKMITYGAAVQSLEVPDKNDNRTNVQLNFDDLQGYLDHSAHFGCTVGRYANRIAKGKFEIDGQVYDKLAINNGPNHLHGGVKSFDRVVWNAEPVENENEVGVRFTYTSPDGEEGYPGKLDTTVTYTLTSDNELKIDYKAVTDKPTVLNLTNHCYWNLGGAGTGEILDHVLMLNCDQYLEAGPGLIPTGKLLPVADTVMEFTTPKPIGQDIAALKQDPEGPRGYDHCYVVNGEPGELRLAARVKDPESGRVMEILTTQPGIQFYSGNFLSGAEKNGGHEQHAAFCLETQHYPDSPNQPDFPSTLLRPGEEFHEVTVHKFLVE